MHKGVQVFGPMCWSDLSRQKEGRPGSAEGQGEEAMSTDTVVEVVAAGAVVDTAAAVVVAVAVVVVAAVLVEDWVDESSCSPPGYPGESGEQTEDQMEGRAVHGLEVIASVDQMGGRRGLTVETGEGTEIVVAVVVVVVAVVVEEK